MPTPKAVDACVLIADILADAIVGMSSADIFRTRALPLSQAIAAFNPGASRVKAARQIQTSGDVAQALEAALRAVARSTNARPIRTAESDRA